ncbi:MAG TPA: hypothetical protein VKP03_03410 [Patescibacteria group bacterium]|nr:hypothetical protein [Patescibacteria group bacterium]
MQYLRIFFKEFFWIDLIFLGLFYLIDNIQDGFIRYYFDFGWLVVLAVISGILWLILEEGEYKSQV